MNDEPNTHDDDKPFSDDYYDSDRYNMADGWEPPDPYKKLREKARAKDTLIGPWNSMVEVRSADEVLRSDGRDEDDEQPARKRPAADLFGPLWRDGELAVLAAETGVGKSILATHIAASIAKGQRIEPFRAPGSPPYAVADRHCNTGGIMTPERGVDAASGGRGGSLRSCGRRVLYIDLERSKAQFRERYSIRSPKGRLLRHKFGPNMKQVWLKDFDEPPPAFEKDLDRWLLHSIRWAIGETDARVIIIDSLSYLAATNAAATRLIKTLKLWTMHNNLSILAIAVRTGSRSDRIPKSQPPLTLSGLHDSISQNADSIFAIGRSTMSPEVRYLKHLKSNNLPATLDGPTVATFRIERVGAQAASLPAAASPATETTEPTEFPVAASRHPALAPSPLTPFIGFSFLGFSEESAHLIDYAAESLKRERAQESRLKKLRTGSVVDMILSPEYQRYLKG